MTGGDSFDISITFSSFQKKEKLKMGGRRHNIRILQSNWRSPRQREGNDVDRNKDLAVKL